MGAILQPFIFKYLSSQGFRELTFVPENEDLVPVSRLLTCLEMDWRSNRDKIRLFPSFQLLKFSGKGRQEAALNVQDFIKWLQGLNTKRVKNPSLVKQFQTHFELNWNCYKEQLANPPQVEIEEEPNEEPKSLNEKLEALDIYIDTPLSMADLYIAFLARFHSMTPDCLNYCRKNQEVHLTQKLPRTTSELTGKKIRSTVHNFNEPLHALKRKIRENWLPTYVFFLENPELYQQSLAFRKQLVKTQSSVYQKVSVDEIEPWNTDSYARQVKKRELTNRQTIYKLYEQGVYAGEHKELSDITLPKRDYTGYGLLDRRDEIIWNRQHSFQPKAAVC